MAMFSAAHHTPSGVTMTLQPRVDPLFMHLGRLAKMDDYDGLRNSIGGYMVGNIQDNFDGQTLWDGSPMHRSAAADSRSDDDADGKTLIDKHLLYDSYTYALVDGGVDVGSNLIYARIHHFGGLAGRGHKTKIEANPVMGMTDAQDAHIGGMILDDLAELERGLSS